MPDPIDLEPMKWRSNRRLRHPFENPKNARNAMIVPLGFLVVGWYSFQWPSFTTFFGVAFFGFLLGGLFAYWLKDVY